LLCIWVWFSIEIPTLVLYERERDGVHLPYFLAHKTHRDISLEILEKMMITVF